MKILKITNLKTGQVQQSDFHTLEECEAHFLNHYWGEEERTIQHAAYDIPHEEVPAVSENGVEISPYIPAWVETIPARTEVIPAEYLKEILDTDAQDAEEIQEQKLQEKIKLIDAGKRVIALFNLRNETKSLTGEQIAQLVTTFASIKGLLETGSLKTAKYLIGQVVADGVIVTDGDKTALIAELDKWIK